jgi:amidase
MVRGMESLVPLLVVRDAAEAIAFYVRALGATQVVRYDNAILATVSHADLSVDGALFSITEELRAWSCDAPPTLGGTPVILQLAVTDAQAALERATAAGAEVVFPLQDFCGERMARVRDPFGHLWILRQRVSRLTVEENQRERDALFARIQEAHSPKADSLSMQSAAELARMIRRREIGAVELTRHFIERIEASDLNAVVVKDFERALEAARRADAARPTGPLHGVPITVKESFDVAGLPTTWGLAAFKHNVAARDAEIVLRLRAAGAIVLGKTNVPAMLGDFQTENEVYGRTVNPWNPSRGPGGSSGGSAAALAAGLTALDVGSDSGGSVRNPAHYCGVFAHKPTFGIVSMRGHALPPIPPEPDMAVAGPLARSAEDLDLALDVLADRLPAARPALRVAVWPTDPVAPVDDEIAARAQMLADRLVRSGFEVSERARPDFDPAAYRSTYAALVAAMSPGEPPRVDPMDDSKAAAFARAMSMSHREWIRHDVERRRLREVWRRFFAEWDVLVCPVMATVAMPHDPRPPMQRSITVNGAEQPYFDQVFWAALATLAYLPATAFPCGRSRDGLPIGLQAIGAEDRTTIAFAGYASLIIS